MIRDPGAGPHESPEPPPVIKYDRIVYDMHRPAVPPAAVSPVTPMDLDSETPLDMTVRRKDSTDRQPDVNTLAAAATVVARGADHSSKQTCPGGIGGGNGSDAPINLNTRPSVITKAPPPPIKKRISSMHSNGEIVIKSAVGDNLSPVNCDVFIEEHFRRSLGNTYASIYGNNNNNNQQKSSGSDTRNSSTSSNSSISSSSSAGGGGGGGVGCNSTSSSTALSASSSSSGISSVASASSSSSSLIGNSVNFSVSSHLGNVSPVVRHNHVIPPVEISPLLKVKIDPVLVQQQQQQQQQQQHQHVRPDLKAKNEPGIVQHVRPDSEEEVDDHFAKALGNDTWKMIQEKKMNL